METPNYLIQTISRLALNSMGLQEDIGLWGVPFQTQYWFGILTLLSAALVVSLLRGRSPSARSWSLTPGQKSIGGAGKSCLTAS